MSSSYNVDEYVYLMIEIGVRFSDSVDWNAFALITEIGMCNDKLKSFSNEIRDRENECIVTDFFHFMCT